LKKTLLTFGKNYDKIIIESKGGGKTPTEKNFKRNLKKPLTSSRKCVIMNTVKRERNTPKDSRNS
jgi:hypothetical protein